MFFCPTLLLNKRRETCVILTSADTVFQKGKEKKKPRTTFTVINSWKGGTAEMFLFKNVNNKRNAIFFAINIEPLGGKNESESCFSLWATRYSMREKTKKTWGVGGICLKWHGCLIITISNLYRRNLEDVSQNSGTVKRTYGHTCKRKKKEG